MQRVFKVENISLLHLMYFTLDKAWSIDIIVYEYATTCRVNTQMDYNNIVFS